MRFRLPILSLSLGAIAVAVQVIPGATGLLQYDRAAGSGEVWRWLTAHLTHFGVDHLVWDIGALVALGWACERVSRARTALALALAACAITPAVALWQPQFATYRGLSGLDSALGGLLGARLLRRSELAPKLIALAALLGFSAKCVSELTTGGTVFASGVGYAPVPLAHLIGLLCGAVAGWVRRPAAIRRAPGAAKPESPGQPGSPLTPTFPSSG